MMLGLLICLLGRGAEGGLCAAALVAAMWGCGTGGEPRPARLPDRACRA